MDKNLVQALKQLGCSDKQVRLYIANVQHGESTLPDIAKAARLQRSTAYVVMSELVAVGLCSEDHKIYAKKYTPVEPDEVLRLVANKYRQLGRTKLALEQALPDLRAQYASQTGRPRVRTYEGAAGLMAIWRDILHEKQEVLLWTNQATERQVFTEEAHDRFIHERCARRIATRVLAVNNAEGLELQATDATALRQTRLLPKDTAFTSETYMYGNTIAVLDVGKTIFGVIIENPQIAASQRALFELAWDTAVHTK